MAREIEEEIDLSGEQPVFEAPKRGRKPKMKETTDVEEEEDNDGLINCLKNEKVNVKFVNKPRTSITDPKHLYSGGMAPTSENVFVTPVLRDGGYVNVLTKDEMKYLEYVMNLEKGALSVRRKVDNFWDDNNPLGIGTISLKKGDNIFDLSDPMDYIRVKVLRANKNIIAPSMRELQDMPKSTYRFVIVNDHDASKDATLNVTMKAKAYMEFGNMKDNNDKMRVVIETLEGRPVAPNAGNDFLQGKIGDLIEANTKAFINIATDTLLDNKILIRRAVDAGVIVKRGNFYYLKENNSPLCGNGQDPTLTSAAKYLSLPKNQELKFTIEAKIK